jgi:hypothetical protein
MEIEEQKDSDKSSVSDRNVYINEIEESEGMFYDSDWPETNILFS